MLASVAITIWMAVHFLPLRSPRTGQWFELVPAGPPEDKIAMAGAGVASVTQGMQTGWFGNSFRGSGRINIVRYWDGQSLSVMINCPRGERQAEQLALAINATAKAIDRVKIPGLHRVAFLRQMQWIGGKQGPQGELPLSSLARGLGSLQVSQPTGSALVVSLWPPGRYWFNRYRKWLAGGEKQQTLLQAGQDPQLSSNGLLSCSIYAIANDQSDANSMVTTTAEHLPWFGFDTQSVAISDTLWLAAMGIMAAGSIGAAVIGLSSIFATVITVLATASCITVAIMMKGVRARRLAYRLAAGIAPVSRSGGSYLRRLARSKQGIGMTQPPVPWIMLAPVQVAALLSLPQMGQAGAGSQAVGTRTAPVGVLTPGGPMVGADTQGRPVYLDPDILEQGLLCTGDPGQGKTVFLLGLWGSLLAMRQIETAAPDHYSRRAMIWVETKGDGAKRAYDMAIRAGVPPEQILSLSASATDGPRLELLDYQDALRGANEITEAMTYSLPQGSIMGSSAQALVAAWRLVLAGDPSAVMGNAGTPPPPAPWVVRALLGGEADPQAQSRWYEWFRDRAASSTNVLAQPGGPDQQGPYAPDTSSPLAQALEGFSYFMRMDRRARETIFTPPINKITDLLSAGTMWTPDANRTSWSVRNILGYRQVAIINFGGGQISPQVAQRLAAMFLYTLSAAVDQVCDGWQHKGLSCSVFSDELSHICGTGTGRDVISTLKDAGRSRGIRQFYATQRLDQVPLMVQSTLRSCDTELFLRTNNPDMAEMAVTDLAGGHNQQWSAADIRNLPPLQGLMRTRVQGLAQPPFNLYLIPEGEFDPARALGRLPVTTTPGYR